MKLIPSNIAIQIPQNEFEAVLYLEKVRDELTELVNTINDSIQTRTESLANTEDDSYSCVEVFSDRKSSELDYGKFQEDMPDVYDRCLSIKASDAEKLLGKDRLRELVIDEVGFDSFEELADITLTDARKNIPKGLQSKYIHESYKSKGYKVVKK